MNDHRHRCPALALALTIATALCAPGAACAAAPSAVEFDEIDHVYTTGAVPPPGSFRQDAGLASAPPSAPPPPQTPRPNRGLFGALGSASTILGGASSVVSASGSLGQGLRIADDFTKLAPLASAMGMAGSRQFDALVQTFVLPRVSPTGAMMLQGFLAARPSTSAASVPRAIRPHRRRRRSSRMPAARCGITPSLRTAGCESTIRIRN